MSSIANIPSYEEMETRIQDDLIALIQSEFVRKGLSYPRIKFWEPDERISDEEILQSYMVYNTFNHVDYGTKKKKSVKLTCDLGRDFQKILFISDLSFEVKTSIMSFSRAVTEVLKTYFMDRNTLYLGKVRLDFITKDRENFVIPNIYLESNIFLYKSKSDATSSIYKEGKYDTNRISTNDYVHSQIEDIIEAQKFYDALASLNQ